MNGIDLFLASFFFFNLETTLMKTKKTSRVWLYALLGIMMFGLFACSKVNKENYDKLKIGMGIDEVTTLLGEPNQCETLIAFKSCTWGKPPTSITIRLVADKVILFENQGL